MSGHLHARLLAFGLILLGMSIFLYKTVQKDYPVVPDQTRTIWNLEVYIEFAAGNRPVRVETFLPARNDVRENVEEQFYSGPFGLRINSEGSDGNRKAIWTYRYPDGPKILRYRTTLTEESRRTPLPDSLQLEGRPPDLPFETNLERQAFIVWISSLRRQSADNESLVELTLQEIFSSNLEDEVAALIRPLPGELGRLELARAVLESQGVPARIANGVYLDDARRRAETESWLGYRVDGKDRRYFPSGSPSKFYPIWYGLDELVEVVGASELSVQISLQPSRLAASTVVQDSDDFILRMFSFDGLPLTTQLVYRVLLTIPVGIMLLVFLRQFVGLQTLGTFMPVLIGIAFRETALLTGLTLFTILIALGLAMRFYLERLKLLLVPRLAVVLVFIVLCMSAITILMAESGQRIGLSISLFPMVILTMTIERMSIVWEEYSGTEAIKQGLGSLAVASVTYLAMSNAYVEYLMYNFPEFLLVIMGLCLLMGRYMGMRLSELSRFRQLSESDQR
ncbi:MAG: UUP1 family membrane protein [Alphaproteobacteria bacterium]|nr:UUP1 family membrane protein [Alphaproteobacteria bacterium]